MSKHDQRDGDAEPVVFRDRRRIDPVTGEVRVPAGEPDGTPAGPGPVDTGPGDDDPGDVDPGDVDPGDEEVPVTEPPADPHVDALTAEVAERTADLQRVSAEYANYRRRVDRDRETVLVGARVQFVSELLTVLDDLDRAETHGDLSGPFKAVADKLVAVVQKQGLEAFGLEGEPFDPSVHEAVQHEDSGADGTTVTVVSAVLRRGYRIADRVLRPAMVTVTDRADDLGQNEAPVDPEV